MSSKTHPNRTLVLAQYPSETYRITGATDRHTGPRSCLRLSQGFRPGNTIQRRTNLFYKTLVPTEFPDIWLKSWREDETIPNVVPLPNVRSVHPVFDYHFPVNGSNIRFPTCGGVVCVRYTCWIFYIWDEVWSVNLFISLMDY